MEAKGDRVNGALGIWNPIPDPMKVLSFEVLRAISVGGKKKNSLAKKRKVLVYVHVYV